MATKSREKREKRRSLARRRAETHVSGYQTSMLKMPDGVGFYELKKGVHLLDIIPYIVGKGNPFAEEGDLYFERTFWIYRGVGPGEKSFVAPGKTFNKPDFIQEYRSKLARDPKADPDLIKALAPKERQIFLVFDRDEPKKGIQLWEVSFHLFGKLLDERINNSREGSGWEDFYFPDEDGSTLSITVTEESGGEYKFNKVMAIDFNRRDEPLPDELVNHGHCLDNMLVETPYEILKKEFLGVSEGEEPDEEAPPARKPRKQKVEKEEEPEVDEDEDEDDDPAPKKEEKPRKKEPTADDFGLSKGDDVIYKGKKCMILKISGDGTSLTLLDEESDERHKAVGPDEVNSVDEDDPDPLVDDNEDDDDEDFLEPKKEAKKEKAKAKVPDDEDDEDDESWDEGWE